MGDWNQTCGLSKLAIRPEDEVVLLILNQATEFNCFGKGFCCSNDLHKPLTIPIEAVYFNYGEIKDVKENKLVRSYLNKIVEYKSDEISEDNYLINEYLDKIVSNPLEIQENFSIMEIVNYIISQEDLPGISYMMFHKKLFYNLVEKFGSRLLSDKGVSYRDYLLDCFNNNLKYIQTRLDCINRESFFGLIKSLESVKELSLVKEGLIDLIIFDRLMNISRMYYAPQSGVGSQYEDYDVHRIIAKFVLDVSEDKNFNKRESFEFSLFS